MSKVLHAGVTITETNRGERSDAGVHAGAVESGHGTIGRS